jgi:hypothetical protein
VFSTEHADDVLGRAVSGRISQCPPTIKEWRLDPELIAIPSVVSTQGDLTLPRICVYLQAEKSSSSHRCFRNSHPNHLDHAFARIELKQPFDEVFQSN